MSSLAYRHSSHRTSARRAIILNPLNVALNVSCNLSDFHFDFQLFACDVPRSGSLFYTALRLQSFLSLFIDIFHQFWKTICHISSNIFFSSLFPFFHDSYFIYIAFLTVTNKFLILHFFTYIHIYFWFCVSVWTCHSIYSFTMSCVLLNLSVRFIELLLDFQPNWPYCDSVPS